ncbi:MAG: SGNH/GDSL hydrolase family protein, partial [Eubacteriales bacterium]
MKKETPRTILLLFIIASVMIFAVSCKQNRDECGDTLPDTERTAQTLLESWQNYTIIRSDTSSAEIKAVASELLRTVRSKTGKSLAISTDLAAKNELEIRIGKTNRTPDDAEVLKTLDFSVSFEEKAVIIRGGTDEATANAMRWFCDNCVTENGILSFKDYKYKAEYALENVNIGGIPLGDFTVSCDKGYETEQTALTAWITEQTGILPSFRESSGTIRLESSASLGYRDIKVCLEGNTVALTVHDFGASMSEAVDFFKEILADRVSDNIDKLDERKKSVGGTNMLSNTFYMLSEEGRLNIAYLGGSITYGQGATEYKNNWVSNTTAWFAKHFPEAEITENNAGICDTCSDYGLFRLEQDVFESGTPDLIFIEYTSNDGGEKKKISIQTESIIRKIYEKNPYCDIVFIYTKPMTEYEGLSVYEADHELSEHYGLMEIGAGQLLCRTMLRDYPSEDGKYGASPLSADRVHPTDEGYAL